MAQKKKTPLRINLRQDRNSASRTFGMWFPEVDRVGTLSTRALSEHIAAHGSIWTRDIVEGVLSQLAECIPELVSQGYGVKLDGLGTFWPTLTNKKGGMAAETLWPTASIPTPRSLVCASTSWVTRRILTT